MSVFHASVLPVIKNEFCYISCQSNLPIYSTIVSWIRSYFDNAMTNSLS